MSTPARARSDPALYARVLQEARPFWGHLGALFVLSLLAAPISLLTPVPLKIVVDSVLGAHPLPGWLAALPADGAGALLAAMAGLVVGLALARHVVDLGFALLRSFTGEKLVLSFRAKLFRHSQRLSLAYHDTQGSTDATYRIQYDAPAIQWITLDAFIPLVTSALTLVAMIAVMARIDSTLALVALAVAPVIYVVSQAYSRRLKRRWREAKDREQETFSVVQEVMSSVRLVKVFAQEEREEERYVSHARRNLREQLRLTFEGGSFGLIVGLCIAAGTAAVLYLGARHVQDGRMTLGDLTLVMSYLAMLYTPLQTVSKSAASLQGSLVSAERAFQLLDQAPEVLERPDARPLARARGHVVFDKVAFAYTPDRPALQDVSFEIPPGARVGIAGTTGAGKSTLVSLLLRLYDPGAGRVLLDGADLRDYRLRDLRNQFAIVPQDTVLFSCSIAENIAYARPEAGEAEVIAAAKAANAHDFIARLAQGYRTEVGERGVQLSGGERQRLALARAFLKDAPVLILDEPTSAVDVKTEAAILEALERLMRGRTTFMIAHRLGTLDFCDVRLQLERGRLVSCTTAPARGTAARASA